MELKSFSIKLNPEERAALYKASTRECRRPEQHIRYLVRQALGISGEQQEQTNSKGSGLVLPDAATFAHSV